MGRFREFLVNPRGQLETSYGHFLIRFEHILDSKFATKFKLVIYLRLQDRANLEAVRKTCYSF